MAISQTEYSSARAHSDRRLVMRLVDYWEDIRGEGAFPLITDFDATAVEGLYPHSFLIEIDRDNLDGSRFRFVGDEIMEECGGDLVGTPVSDVPRGTLLSRLTDHYIQVLANECPMGFEAAFSHSETTEILYRGIMLPMSDDGDRIDYILGAINCRERTIEEDAAPPDFLPTGAAREAATDGLYTGKNGLAKSAPDMGDTAPSSDAAPSTRGAEAPAAQTPSPATDQTREDLLFDRLQDCRGTAYMVQEADNLARNALYETLRKAFALARLGETLPEDYRRILFEHDIKPRPDQPFQTVLRLVFGNSYDPERLAEYAAALSYAKRRNQTPETLVAFLEGHEDGIKGCARAEPIPEIPITAFNRRIREGAS